MNQTRGLRRDLRCRPCPASTRLEVLEQRGARIAAEVRQCQPIERKEDANANEPCSDRDLRLASKH